MTPAPMPVVHLELLRLLPIKLEASASRSPRGEHHSLRRASPRETPRRANGSLPAPRSSISRSGRLPGSLAAAATDSADWYRPNSAISRLSTPTACAPRSTRSRARASGRGPVISFDTKGVEEMGRIVGS
jgi:hypothetical protein